MIHKCICKNIQSSMPPNTYILEINILGFLYLIEKNYLNNKIDYIYFTNKTNSKLWKQLEHNINNIIENIESERKEFQSMFKYELIKHKINIKIYNSYAQKEKQYIEKVLHKEFEKKKQNLLKNIDNNINIKILTELIFIYIFSKNKINEYIFSDDIKSYIKSLKLDIKKILHHKTNTNIPKNVNSYKLKEKIKYENCIVSLINIKDIKYWIENYNIYEIIFFTIRLNNINHFLSKIYQNKSKISFQIKIN